MEHTQAEKYWKFGVLLLLLGALAVLVPIPVVADSVPSGWTCTGNCGSSGSDGVVTLSPTGNSSYQWVSTYKGTLGAGALPSGPLGDEQDGSTLATTTFSATAGEALNFYFNYVTSDGSLTYTDYAWAELYSAATNTPVALLFTARTAPTGSIVPGFGMPAPLATLNPASVPIIPNQTTWSPLGPSSTGQCWDAGCGNTGWINSNYIISAAGDYYLVIGVVNWHDEAYDSGLAMDGVTVGGEPITPPSTVPEPGTLMLLSGGVIPMIRRLLRRKQC